MNRKQRRTFDSLHRRRKLRYMVMLPGLFTSEDMDFAFATFKDRW